MWRLLCDQNIRTDTVQHLRSKGHDVVGTRDLGLELASDERILALAVKEGRILITFNSDFGDIRRFPPEKHCGIIRLRIHPQDPMRVHDALDRALQTLTNESIAGKIATIDRNRIRLRGGITPE